MYSNEPIVRAFVFRKVRVLTSEAGLAQAPTDLFTIVRNTM